MLTACNNDEPITNDTPDQTQDNVTDDVTDIVEELPSEIKNIILELQKYADALESDDFEKLRSLLKEGSDRKLELDEK